MEQIDCHSTASGKGTAKLFFGNKQRYCKGHGKTNGIAEQATEDSIQGCLSQIIIIIASVENFRRQRFVFRFQNQEQYERNDEYTGQPLVFSGTKPRK